MANFTLPENIHQLIANITFPVTTEELADYAEDQGASEEILAQLRFAPGHIFNSMQDINLTYGLIYEFEHNDVAWQEAANDDMQSPEESAIHVEPEPTPESDGLPS